MLTKYPDALVGEDLEYEGVGNGVVFAKGGNEETVLDAMLVVDVVIDSSVFVCSVGGVMRGLGEAKG